MSCAKRKSADLGRGKRKVRAMDGKALPVEDYESEADAGLVESQSFFRNPESLTNYISAGHVYQQTFRSTCEEATSRLHQTMAMQEVEIAHMGDNFIFNFQGLGHAIRPDMRQHSSFPSLAAVETIIRQVMSEARMVQRLYAAAIHDIEQIQSPDHGCDNIYQDLKSMQNVLGVGKKLALHNMMAFTAFENPSTAQSNMMEPDIDQASHAPWTQLVASTALVGESANWGEAACRTTKALGKLGAYILPIH